MARPRGRRETQDMMFRRTNAGRSPQADVWTASIDLGSDPDRVLRALTDPAAIAQWAPVSFEVDGIAGSRLRAGSRERVSGSIAGIRTTFVVEVRSADGERLELVARGPVSLDVKYRFERHDAGVRVNARVGIQPQRGLTAQVLRAAVGALLNAGALGSALRRLEASLSAPLEADVLAA
jgi:Polyketide cyclase / dehydrase and lipid transport